MDRDRSLVGRRTLGPVATAGLVALPVAFLGYFFAYPLVSITIRGLTGDNGLDLTAIGDIVSDAGLRRVATFTVWQAILSTLLTVVLGIPLAWVFARFTFPGRRVLWAATLVPFVLPTLVVATAFLNLVGPNGALGVDLTGTLAVILIAHVFYNLAVVVRGVGAYWARIDPTIAQAAVTLGATPWRAFRTVTLPILRPAIASTSALVFLFSFTSFGVILLLGDLSHSTLEVEIWRQATAFLRLDIASTLAVVQLIGIGFILWWYSRVEARTRVEFRHSIARLRRPRPGRERWLVWSTLAIGIAFVSVPLGLLVLRSLAQPSGGIGFENYRNLVDLPSASAGFVDASLAIGNSFRFAFAAVAIGLLIGLLAATALSYADRRSARTFDVFVMLPLGTSAVTIGFGFLVALDWPIDLRTSLILIPIAHALVGIPFVVRSISPTFGSIDNRLREASATLGASPLRTWMSVDLRLVSRAILAGAAFAFAISMGEFGATTFIARPASPTIPIAIFRYLGRPGDAPFGAALALSVLLMAVTAATIIAIDAVGSRSEHLS